MMEVKQGVKFLGKLIINREKRGEKNGVVLFS